MAHRSVSLVKKTLRVAEGAWQLAR